MNCITVHKCTEMYSEPEIQNLEDLRRGPERSSLRRDKKANVADSEASSTVVCKGYAELFSKASENLTLILSSVVVIYICVLCVMKMKESAQQIALDLFSFVFG